MKFNTINRTAKAVVMSLAIGLGTVACSRDYTADYVYAVSNSNGDISAFAVDFQTGVLTQIPGSPFTTNMTNPSTLVAAPNGKTIYEIGGSQNANVGVFQIGYDGKLYGAATPNITGTYPTAAAIDASGKFLYVTYTYQSGFSPVSLGPGGVSIFPIKADGTLGTPTNVNVGNNPVAIAVSTPVCDYAPSAATGSAGNPACVVYGSGSATNNGVQSVYVYVVDAETQSTVPTILGFAQNMTTGALTQIPGPNVHNGTNAGVSPSSIVVDLTGKFVYITDKQQNEIFGYQISNSATGAAGTDGSLTPLVSSPFATGQYPVNITIDPRDKYVYVANYNSNTVSSYSLNLSNGSLGASAGSGFTTETAPTCVTVDPALGIYLYTSNYLGASISGGNLSPDTGQLTAVPNVFFPTIPQPACLVSVPNGAHSIQIVNK